MAANTRTVITAQSVKWKGTLYPPGVKLELPARLAADLVASGAAVHPPAPEQVEAEQPGPATMPETVSETETAPEPGPDENT